VPSEVGRHSLNGWGLVLATGAMLLAAGAARASGPYIEYLREGDSPSVLECSASGRCELNNGVPVGRKRDFTLTPRRLAELRAAFHDARWRSLRSAYGPSRVGGQPTGYYLVTYAGRRVGIGFPALAQKRVPQRLVRVLNVLNAIVAAH